MWGARRSARCLRLWDTTPCNVTPVSGDTPPCKVTPVSGDATPCKVTPVIPHGVLSLGIQPRVKSPRSSYTGLHPPCKSHFGHPTRGCSEVTPAILHGVVSPDCRLRACIPPPSTSHRSLSTPISPPPVALCNGGPKQVCQFSDTTTTHQPGK